jgi:hypothetical protein
MKTLLKYLGSIIILIGVALLAIYFFTKSSDNTYLASAGIIMIVGFLTHIITNKTID